MSTKVRGVCTFGMFSASSAASLDSLSAISLPLFLHDQESNSILFLYFEFLECPWFVKFQMLWIYVIYLPSRE